MGLIHDINEKISDSGFDKFDLNVDKPTAPMLNTLCDILAQNWIAIEEGKNKAYRG